MTLFAAVLVWGAVIAGPATAGPSKAAKGKPAKSTAYTQPVWYIPPAPGGDGTFDVLIVPPNHGQVLNGNGVLGGVEGGASELTPFNSYLRAVEDSVADFDRAVVDSFGSVALKNALRTEVYVLGRDPVPAEALLDPEVVILSDESKGPILGVALRTNPCLVDNSKFFVTSFTYADMYNVNAQEYGHCLGLDHVGGGPKGDQTIAHDTLNGTYADTPGTAGTHLHRVSNLNVLGLENIWVKKSTATATLDPAAYRTR